MEKQLKVTVYGHSEKVKDTAAMTERLLTAHERLDSATVCEIAAHLFTAREERAEVARRLIQVAGEPDELRAQLAVDILGLLGMALESDYSDQLVTSAKSRFTPEALCNLANDEKHRQEMPRPRPTMSQGLRLLRSVIGMASRKGGVKASEFLSGIEAKVADTALAALVAKWKSRD